MHSNHCKNCNGTLSENDQFCSSCGQTAHVHRFTFGHLLHEFFHAFTHADKGILFLVKSLAVQPGTTIANYLNGQRKKYFNPFTFLLLCIGFFVFMNSVFKPFGEAPKTDTALLQRMPPEGQKMYLQFIERSTTVYNLTQKHSNIVTMVGLPLLAIVFWLFYRRKGFNYTEFVVAMILLGSFSNLFFSLFVTPTRALVHSQSAYFFILFGSLFLQAFYTAWGITVVLRTKSKTNYFGVLGVTLLAYLFWTLICFVFTIWFMARERTGLVLETMWKQFTH